LEHFVWYGNWYGIKIGIHSFNPDISIAPLEVHYYSEMLPTTALTDAVSELTRQSATGNCE